VENLALELTWSVIPMVLAMGIFAWGAVLYYDFSNVPSNTVDISVIGKQWMWKIQHSNGRARSQRTSHPGGQGCQDHHDLAGRASRASTSPPSA
jgi:cytochrome c oxidase subunit 2